jgi:hypothetical protein
MLRHPAREGIYGPGRVDPTVRLKENAPECMGMNPLA